MSYDEFRRRIDTARNILVGAVPSPAGQIDQITYALMYKFMNDIDDQAAALGGKRSFFIGDYEKYNWHKLMDSSLGAHERLELYRQAIQNMAKNPNIPELFRGIYQNAFLPFNSPNVLTMLLKEINNFNHGENDDIGDVYEYLLSITGAQGDVGQFRTPRHIIKFIVEAVNPTKGDTVIDPACGTAGFLIAAYSHVRAQHDGKDQQGNPNNEHRLSADELAKIHHNYRGFDIDPTMVRTAKVNMYLHGFKTPDIINHDSLSSEDYWNDRYDVILANPPFMTPKGGIQPHKKFGITANRAEVLFVDYIASHLKPTGRAGIIVPEGVIFQSGKAYKELRKNLVENSLYAVVSLPAGVFQPYSGVKTSILLLDKELAKQNDEILFVKAENDGYSLGAQRRPVAGGQFPEALEVIDKFKKGEELQSEFAYVVKRNKVAESGDYNLSGDRYKIQNILTNADMELARVGDIIIENVKSTIKVGDAKISKGSIDFFTSGREQLKYDETLVTGKNLFLATGGNANVFYSDVPAAYSTDTWSITSKDEDKALTKYIYYNLSNKLEHINTTMFKGAGLKHLDKHLLRDFKIPLPPIEIQREIVAELDGYQRIIDAAQTIVKTYKPILKINPEWEKNDLGDYVEVFSGYAFKSELFNDHGEGMPLIRIRDVKPNTTKTYYTGDYDDKYLVKNSDLLIGMDGEFNPIIWQGGDALLNQRVCRIENFSGILPGYTIQVLREELKKIEKATYAVTVKHISAKQIKQIQVPIPSIEEQKQIIAELEAEQKLIDANKKLIETFQFKIKSKIAEVWGE